MARSFKIKKERKKRNRDLEGRKRGAQQLLHAIGHFGKLLRHLGYTPDSAPTHNLFLANPREECLRGGLGNKVKRAKRRGFEETIGRFGS